MQAYGYVRVSGKSQVDGHGFDRQEETITAYAKKAGCEIVAFFREEAISGTIDESERPAFKTMMSEILRNGVKTVIVERLDRLAREYRVQESILIFLASKGVDLIVATTEENVTEAVNADPMKKALVQMQGVFAELEKSLLVLKLRRARTRKKETVGKCEGRKSYAERKPEILDEIRALRRKPKKGKRLTYQQIAESLNERGLTTADKKAFTASNVGRIIFSMKK